MLTAAALAAVVRRQLSLCCCCGCRCGGCCRGGCCCARLRRVDDESHRQLSRSRREHRRRLADPRHSQMGQRRACMDQGDERLVPTLRLLRATWRPLWRSSGPGEHCGGHRCEGGCRLRGVTTATVRRLQRVAHQQHAPAKRRRSRVITRTARSANRGVEELAVDRIRDEHGATAELQRQCVDRVVGDSGECAPGRDVAEIARGSHRDRARRLGLEMGEVRTWNASSRSARPRRGGAARPCDPRRRGGHGPIHYTRVCSACKHSRDGAEMSRLLPVEKRPPEVT